METLINNLSIITSIIAENFWFILLIIAIISCKRLRYASVILLIYPAITESMIHPIVIAIILLSLIMIDWGNSKVYWKNHYRTKYTKYINAIKTVYDKKLANTDNYNDNNK